MLAILGLAWSVISFDDFAIPKLIWHGIQAITPF